MAISAMVARPTGPLIRKHQRQDQLSASHPPSAGPTTGATTTATPNNAKACPRFSGGNEAARMDCDTGTMPPPAKPCRMRNKRSEFEIPRLRAEHRAYAEKSEAHQEEGLAAEPPGEEGARRQTDCVGDEIGRYYPRGFVIADPHAAGEVGQDGVGDRGVEHLHEGRERDQNGDQPGAGRRCAARRRSAGPRRGVAHARPHHCSTRARSRS